MHRTESPLKLQVVASPTVPIAIGGTFSPTTATILTGPTEAVLVDTLFAPADVERLAEAITATGKKLTTIYITHAHFDHYFGLGTLLARFPDARGVALAPVAEFVTETHELNCGLASQWLAGNIVDADALPEPLAEETILLDGHELQPIEIGQADIAHNTVLHAPSIGAVVAGDIVYNGVHQMLGVSQPGDWPQWIESVEKLAALNPRVVVAGHKRPDTADDDIHEILYGTQAYIAAFIDELDQAEDAAALILRMTERFPDRINLPTLEFSAAAGIRHRRTAPTPGSTA
jgi:glyoxylase-like metal-dependent hydrolase (beta-lactamase superfamily II)